MKLHFGLRVNSNQVKATQSGRLIRCDGSTYDPAHKIPAMPESKSTLTLLNLTHSTTYLCKQITPHSIYMIPYIYLQVLESMNHFIFKSMILGGRRFLVT